MTLLMRAIRHEGRQINTRYYRDPRPWARAWPWGYLHRWAGVRIITDMRWPNEDIALLPRLEMIYHRHLETT